MKTDPPRLIALLGAECTGKSTLCEALAPVLPGLWVPEVLRGFCDEHGRTPRAHEQRAVFQRQLAAEREALALAGGRGLPWVLVDSTPLATALYSVEVFDDPSLLEAALAHQRHYRLTLLAGADIAWQADGIQRDGPKARARFQQRLVAALADAAIGHVRLEGTLPVRLAHAIGAVRALDAGASTAASTL